jgi:hypothetical protein
MEESMNLRIMKVLEINHINKHGDILYQNKNMGNLLHLAGEEFILKALFGGVALPSEYYLGLDARTVLNRADQISDIASIEPASSGYTRQNVGTASFTFVTNTTGDYQANSPVVLFRAIGGSWGPVRNVFLATQGAYSGYLISSVPLGSNLTVQDGEIISIRIGLGLRNST